MQIICICQVFAFANRTVRWFTIEKASGILPTMHISDSTTTLKKHGMKVTPVRCAVLDILSRASVPRTAQQITSAIRLPSVDLVTVYRTLHSFVDEGLVRAVAIQRGTESFELATEDDHHHIICTVCNRIEDFHGCEAEKLARAALKKSKLFSRITTHAFELYGVCKKCAKSPPKK